MLKFQSHNGAIAALTKYMSHNATTMFQSHNGAIAAFSAISQLRDGRWFQSHNGAIAAEDIPGELESEFAFQSHNGAIAAGPIYTSNAVHDLFQSHNGAIAARASAEEKLLLAGFNPTMVRLLLCGDDKGHAGLLEFQSHNGAIAAIPFGQGLGVFERVSIPQWCDCCQGKNLGFDGKIGRKGEGVAVDLRLAENPKGVDGK